MSKSQSTIDSKLALLISCLSLLVSGLTGICVWEQSRDAHDQLIYGNRPLLAFDTEDDETEFPLGIQIMNSGTGPAIVDEVIYYVDKKPVKDWVEIAKVGNINYDTLSYFDLEKDDPFGVGEKYWPIKYKRVGKKNTQDAERFADFIDQHFAIRINYHSLHGDHFTKCSTDSLCGN